MRASSENILSPEAVKMLQKTPNSSHRRSRSEHLLENQPDTPITEQQLKTRLQKFQKLLEVDNVNLDALQKLSWQVDSKATLFSNSLFLTRQKPKKGNPFTISTVGMEVIA